MFIEPPFLEVRRPKRSEASFCLVAECASLRFGLFLPLPASGRGPGG
jgi:hypothetical protein